MSVDAHMTYRIGAYVVDARNGQLGQLVDTDGPYVILRPSLGGREWSCPPSALRLATRAEREAMDVRVDEGTRA